MPRAKRSVEEVDGNAADQQPSKAQKNGTGQQPERETQSTAGAIQPPQSEGEVNEAPQSRNLPDGISYITFARPMFDLREQLDAEDVDLEDDAVAAPINKDYNEQMKKFTDKPLSEFPGHKWTASKKASERLDHFAHENHHRDADTFGCYFYNDFSAYGAQEVIENMNSMMSLAKKEPCPFKVWSTIEVINLYLNFVGLGQWPMQDDGEGFTGTAELLSYATLAGLGSLESKDLLKSDSPIPNISLIVSMFYHWWSELEGMGEFSDKAPMQIMAMMRKHDIEVDALFDNSEADKWSEKVAKMAPSSKVFTFVNKNDKTNDKFNFKKEWTAFTKKQGKRSEGKITIGGTHYDITKMSASERKKAAYDKRDPLQGISKEDIARTAKVL